MLQSEHNCSRRGFAPINRSVFLSHRRKFNLTVRFLSLVHPISYSVTSKNDSVSGTRCGHSLWRFTKFKKHFLFFLVSNSFRSFFFCPFFCYTLESTSIYFTIFLKSRHNIRGFCVFHLSILHIVKFLFLCIVLAISKFPSLTILYFNFSHRIHF